jgi:hypothetical protein
MSCQAHPDKDNQQYFEHALDRIAEREYFGHQHPRGHRGLLHLFLSDRVR